MGGGRGHRGCASVKCWALVCMVLTRCFCNFLPAVVGPAFDVGCFVPVPDLKAYCSCCEVWYFLLGSGREGDLFVC